MIDEMNAEESLPMRMSETTDEPAAPGAKILVVAHGYPPNQLAGAEQQMRRKVRWWKQHGQVVRVLAADPHLSSDYPLGRCDTRLEVDDDVPVYRLRFAVADSSQPLDETYRHKLLGPELRRQIEEFQPDIVYQLSGLLFGLLPIEMAAEHDVASVLFATDFWHLCQRHTLLRPDGTCCPGPRHPADCAACRSTARRPFASLGTRAQGAAWSFLAASGMAANRFAGIQTPGVRSFALREARVNSALASVGLIVCNSRFLAGIFDALGVERERVLTVRQGLDELPTTAGHRSASTNSDRLRVLYLGQVTRHKGVDLLIRAASALIRDGHDIEVRIHGPLTDGALKVDDDGGGRIQIGEPLSRDGVREALARADVLVVPSRWYENSPNVILEAQAQGLPVVTANHGGMAEMVRDRVDGMLFAPGNADALTRALRELALDRPLLQRLSANVVRPHSVDVEMIPEDRALAALLHGRSHHRPLAS